MAISLAGLLLVAPHAAVPRALDKADALNQQARQLYSQGRYSEAIRIVQSLLELYKKAFSRIILPLRQRSIILLFLYLTQGLCRC